jgi:hypothetical protein
MTSETGSMKLRSWTTLVPVLIRGELAIGAQLRAAKLVRGRSVWILTMMQSCASAAKLRAGAHSLSVGMSATSATGSRHLGSSTGSPRCGCQQRASSR